MANYESKVKLPSNGIIYSEESNIPAELTIRAMTTKEEKIIFGSTNGENVMDEVLSACIKDDIDIKKLVNQDKMYLLIRLRILSYGSEYHITTSCPNCGATDEYKINLEKLNVEYLKKSQYNKGTSFTLPRSKDQITIKLLDGYDSDNVTERINRQLKMAKQSKVKLTYDSASFEQTSAARIQTKNGKELTDEEKLKYFDEMPAMDSAYIRDKMDGIIFGIDSTVNLTCNTCGQGFVGFYSMGPEFFHPRFD